MRKLVSSLAAAAAVAALAVTTAVAQTPTPVTQGTSAIKRNIVQKFDVPGTNLETIVAHVEIAPNFKAGRHTHPGQVAAYIIEGEFFITFDGQPEKQLKPGDSVLVPDGTVHDEGTKGAATKFVAIYVVEKGKPLVAPVK